MAVPKRKTSPSRTGKRRSHIKFSIKNVIEDKKSGEYRLSHHLDLKTGMYKGRQILTPDKQMWGWFEQRQITSLTVDPDSKNVSSIVAFGTTTDNYEEYPEKYGLMSRRAIQREPTWAATLESAATTGTKSYEERLRVN